MDFEIEHFSFFSIQAVNLVLGLLGGSFPPQYSIAPKIKSVPRCSFFVGACGLPKSTLSRVASDY